MNTPQHIQSGETRYQPAQDTAPRTAANGARPPGPVGRFAGLSLLMDLGRDFTGYIHRHHRQHGDIFYSRMVWEHVYTVCSPDLMRGLLVDNAAGTIRQERPMAVFAQAQGPHSVMVTEGEQWQRLHRILMPGFSPKRVAGYADLMVSAARRSLDAAVPTASDRATVQVDELMNLLTMDVILRSLFSMRTDETSREVAHAVKLLDDIAMKEMFWPATLPDWLPLPGKADKRWALGKLDGLIQRHIRARRKADAATAPQDDLLAMMLAARDDEASTREGDTAEAARLTLSDDEIRDQCKVTFLAGFETSSTALQWWTWLMARHPACAQRAWAEVDSVIGQRDPTPQDVPRLPWLTATLKEAMRLYPPAPAVVTRRATSELRLGGWVIPKGSLVMAVPWAAMHDEAIFPEPDTFMPERFMPNAPPLPRGAWMPFGTGPRVCIGQHFAMLEMNLVAAMLLQRYRLVPTPGEAEPQPELQITLRPRGGLKVDFRRRGAWAA